MVLRTAVTWGTSVMGVRELAGQQSLVLGEQPDALVQKPEGVAIPDSPIRAVAGGWELDARGCGGGMVMLRGRQENPAQLAAAGAPIPIVAGDYGILQYGAYSVFFQFTHGTKPPAGSIGISWLLVLSFFLSAFLCLGGLALLWTQVTPPPLDKPLELTSRQELRLLLGDLVEEEEEEPPKTSGEDESKGSGVKDPGAKDKKEQGGGKKIAGAEGKLGKQGAAEDTRIPGKVEGGLGGMTDVLASDVGDEVRETLSTIDSVADALGGLNSDDIVLGAGSGTGLKGSGPGGGGEGPGGVPFGSGTLDTGWGPGRGGGYGSGRGGPGGRGKGGPGRGGKGDGDGKGSGSGEKEVVGGAGKAKRGEGLSPAQIARVVNSRYGAYRACYESAAARNPGLQGGVTIAFSIGPGGSVSSASVAGSSLGNPRVESCILRQFRRLKFPQADKPTGASYPLSFRPSKSTKKKKR